MTVAEPENAVPFNYDDDNLFENEKIKLSVPEGALYNNFDFVYSSEPSFPGCYSAYHFIHKKNVPLHTGADLKIKVENLPNHLQTKALLANVVITSYSIHYTKLYENLKKHLQNIPTGARFWQRHIL